ncbi:MAG: DUF4174 domain-containing protein [Armatimonadetes bacterium]|nr:DUF4174 domain-containing protein [Armatimonadota bacterium]
MSLISEGAHLPPFALLDLQSGRRVEYAAFLRSRRIVVLVVNDAGKAWLAGAVREAKAFAERDLTVLAVTKSDEKPGNLPPHFHVLHDADGAVATKLGGAGAFYLVGKDTGIKIAGRVPVPVPALFRTIDAMPMRKQEAQGRG